MTTAAGGSFVASQTAENSSKEQSVNKEPHVASTITANGAAHHNDANHEGVLKDAALKRELDIQKPVSNISTLGYWPLKFKYIIIIVYMYLDLCMYIICVCTSVVSHTQ